MAGILGGDPRGLEPYIRASAKQHGVDPDTAIRVARSEGLSRFLGDNGKSGGAFQLYTGGGVGNAFQKETGLNPLDPANERATIDYAMKTAAHGGWGPWNGAKAQGITGMMGINGQPMASQPSFANTTPTSAGPSSVAPPSTPPAQGGQPNTLSAGNPLANAAAVGPQAATPMHNNQNVDAALRAAFQPIVPDQINSLLGPAMGHMQSMAPPIAYYQPRPTVPIPTRGSS